MKRLEQTPWFPPSLPPLSPSSCRENRLPAIRPTVFLPLLRFIIILRGTRDDRSFVLIVLKYRVSASTASACPVATHVIFHLYRRLRTFIVELGPLYYSVISMHFIFNDFSTTSIVRVSSTIQGSSVYRGSSNFSDWPNDNVAGIIVQVFE